MARRLAQGRRACAPTPPNCIGAVRPLQVRSFLRFQGFHTGSLFSQRGVAECLQTEPLITQEALLIVKQRVKLAHRAVVNGHPDLDGQPTVGVAVPGERLPALQFLGVGLILLTVTALSVYSNVQPGAGDNGGRRVPERPD